MERGPGKSGLSPHPLTPTKDQSRDTGEKGALEPPNTPKGTRGYTLRFEGEPETKCSGFGKSNDYGARGRVREAN